ncbi:MAG: hypothetical protein K6E85_09045 [Lachnospiraceae bacterium]|nr:hypothetical protein [Lachnospiraceae bacterium]
MEKSGFYIIKDEFFSEMNDPYLKGNKSENRPHYYCFRDSNYSTIYWMVPLSSKINKYKALIDKKEKNGQPCDILHIVKLSDDRESVFLIQDIFPITEKYIEREYTIAGKPLKLTSEHVINEIDKKCKKVIGLLKRGVRFMPTQPDVIKIYDFLIKNKEGE